MRWLILAQAAAVDAELRALFDEWFAQAIADIRVDRKRVIEVLAASWTHLLSDARGRSGR